MFRFWAIFISLQAVLLAGLVTAQSSARTSVTVYWGQGPNQKRLLYFCQQPTIDTIILSFIHVFPAQGNGYPGSNFGNQCAGGPFVYKGPGNDPSKNQLQSSCPQMVADIPVCQSTYKKKILLSLGGGTNTYQLAGAESGIAFANFLWGAFGPQTASWLNAGKPRPFDGPSKQPVEVDGFDFDIEFPSTDNSAGYIAMINRLRALFPLSKKRYIITGAPQCIVPDANMGRMITGAKFDILYIQYYNTPQCSARSWWNANPNYPRTRRENVSGFRTSYQQWVTFLATTASKDAKLHIGLPGSPKATFDPSFYVPSSIVSNLLRAYFCKPKFGGVMVWEATYADEARVGGTSVTFYQHVKKVLIALSRDKSTACYGK